jgi:hypothetical protein
MKNDPAFLSEVISYPAFLNEVTSYPVFLNNVTSYPAFFKRSLTNARIQTAWRPGLVPLALERTLGVQSPVGHPELGIGTACVPESHHKVLFSLFMPIPL